MNRAEIIQFLNSNPACSLATVDGDFPRVRGMLVYRADESGIVFHTGRAKDLFKQMTRNPNVELCFFDPKSNTQVRVSGRAEIISDRKLEDEIIANRPFMKPWIEQHGRELLAVFRVKDCVASVWTLTTNLDAKQFVKL